MNIKVYYREFIAKKLRRIDVDEASSHRQAINLVESSLKTDGEVFHKPILAVIQGGKA